MPFLRFLCWTALMAYIAYLTVSIIWSVKLIEVIPMPVYDPAQVWNQGPSKRHIVSPEKSPPYIGVEKGSYEKGVYRDDMSRPVERGIE